MRSGSSRLFSVNAGLVRDDRDDPLNPRFGGTRSFVDGVVVKGLRLRL